MNKPIQILLIDADGGDRAAIVAELRRAFFRVEIHAAADAHALNDAWATLATRDLIVCESELGFTDAIAVLRRAREHDVPVVVCTRNQRAEDAVRALKAGAFDYVLKAELARLGQAARAAVVATRQRRAGDASEARYRDLFDGMLVGIYQAGADGKLLDANPAMLQITGYASQDEILGASFLDFFLDANQQRAWQAAMQAQGTVANYDIKLRRRDGTIIWVESNARAVRDEAGALRYYEGSLENITERKWTEERLNILAHYDPLTGLPNRLLFNQQLQAAIAAAGEQDLLVGVVFIDLDRFKYINDTLGHETGDLVLKAVAARLTACVREGNTVARLSGDEFGVILSRVAHIDDITQAADNILESFSQPYYVPGRELFITTSLGITVWPFDDNNPEGLVKNAEVAMYSAKDRGRNNYRYYSVDMTATVSRHLAMEHALRRAVEREEFQLHYQPQIDVASGKMIGMEALMRWKAKSDLVSPAEFIPLAEETGLIVPMGEWALRTACAQNKAWQDAGLAPMRVAVNLSARQFQSPGLLATIRNVLEETGLDPNYLELEITESVLMQNTDATIRVLQDLSAMGIHLSIDDFGTGYSSLSYLKRFPIDALKIDQSFVRDITTDPDDAAIATAIIAMAHGLGVKVIAEGVETEEQMRFLRKHKSEVMQGYYYSPPMPANAFARWLERGQAVAVH